MKRQAKGLLNGPQIRQSAQQIWLAGLGAFALAGEQGGKMFTQLVKKGQGVEKLNKARISKMLAKVERVSGDARRAIGKITVPFDAPVTTTLHRLGVPTRHEIVTLTKRVEELTRSVQRRNVRHAAHKRAPAHPAREHAGVA